MNAFFSIIQRFGKSEMSTFERCLQESKTFSPIFATLDVFIYSIPEYLNAFSSIVKSSEFSSNSTVLIEKQFEKADFPIIVIDDGISISVNDVQFMNVDLFIDVNDEGIITFFSDKQPSKADSLISF